MKSEINHLMLELKQPPKYFKLFKTRSELVGLASFKGAQILEKIMKKKVQIMIISVMEILLETSEIKKTNKDILQ